MRRQAAGSARGCSRCQRSRCAAAALLNLLWQRRAELSIPCQPARFFCRCHVLTRPPHQSPSTAACAQLQADMPAVMSTVEAAYTSVSLFTRKIERNRKPRNLPALSLHSEEAGHAPPCSSEAASRAPCSRSPALTTRAHCCVEVRRVFPAGQACSGRLHERVPCLWRRPPAALGGGSRSACAGCTQWRHGRRVRLARTRRRSRRNPSG